MFTKMIICKHIRLQIKQVQFNLLFADFQFSYQT